MKIIAIDNESREVKVGEKIISFRGEEAVYKGCNQYGRNRVYVRWLYDNDEETGMDYEYFPEVFNLKLKLVEDKGDII